MIAARARAFLGALYWPALALGYLALAWLLAPQLLVGPLEGSDWPNALAFADWIARSLPAMPFWFPYQGGGVSPSAGYAVTPMYAIAILNRLGLDLVTAGRLLAFASMVGGSVGVAAGARAFGLGRGAAAIAGALWLLPPANWNLLIRVGFFSNAVASGLFPGALAAMVAYMRLPGMRLDRRGVLLYAAAVGLAVATFLAHPVFAVVPLVLAGVAGLRHDLRSLGRLLAVGLGSMLVAAGALTAFVLYLRAADATATGQLTPSVLLTQLIPTEVLLGQTEAAWTTGLLDGMSLTPFLIALSLLGAVSALGRPALRLFVLGTAACAGFIFSFDVQVALVSAASGFSPLLGFRGWLIFLITGMAILSAAALETLAAVRPRAVARAVVAVGLVAGLVALEGIGYGAHPTGEPSFVRVRLPQALAGHDPRAGAGGTSAIRYDLDDVRAVAARLQGVSGRVDLSPVLGHFYKGFPLVSDARLVSLYTFQLSLFHQSWADQQQAMYLPNEYGVAGASVSEMSAWFGIERVALADVDDRERYRAAGWRVDDGAIAYAHAPAPRTLAAFRERGVVLHVGRAASETFRNTYRFASAGGLPFGLGWIVEGPECVDEVPLVDLARFDVLILEDHCELDPAAAAEKVAAYVEGGGRLFIETGWEWSRYFRAAATPSFVPAQRLDWRSIGLTPSLALDATLVDVSGIDQSRFGDFGYEDGSWNVSVGALRPWATPVLSAGGLPVVAAGAFGQGRVVWSGMNLVSHARAKESAAERDLYARLMSWLLDGATAPRELEVSEVTEDGGTVVVPGSGWLLWRESPAFAEVTPATEGRYRAGPGLLLTRAEAGRYRVEQHPSLAIRLGALLGALASIVFLLWTALGLRFAGAADPGAALGAIIRGARRAATGWIGGEDDEE